MNDDNSTQAEVAKSAVDRDSKADNEPSELVVGSVTFVIFIVFMAVWMYSTA